MSKITSKYQVSIPKALAERVGVKPGDEINWSVVGNELRVRRNGARTPLSIEERLKIFDASMQRQQARNRAYRGPKSQSRGWTREELYGDRGRRR